MRGITYSLPEPSAVTAHKNEGILPETHTEEGCGRAEGLALEVEFGSMKHTGSSTEAHHSVFVVAMVQILLRVFVTVSVAGVEAKLLKSSPFASVCAHLIFRLISNEQLELNFSARVRQNNEIFFVFLG